MVALSGKWEEVAVEVLGRGVGNRPWLARIVLALEAGMFEPFVFRLNSTFPDRHPDQPFLSFS